MARSHFTLSLLLATSLLGGSGCVVTHAGYPDPTTGPHPMFAKAQAAYLRGDLDKSLTLFRAYRAGYASDGFDADAFYWEGVILLEQQNYTEGRESLAIAAREARDHTMAANAFVGLGDCAYAEQDWDTARRHYQKVVDWRLPEARNDYALYRLGLVRQRLGDWGGAQSFFKLALQQYPHTPLKAKLQAQLDFVARSFYLDMGQFATATAARGLQTDLHSQGIRSKVVRNPWGNGYRVWIGGYRGHADATAAQADLPVLLRTKSTLIP